MKIPVAGFIYSSNEYNGQGVHSHHLFLTAWNGRPVHMHVHEFSGVTSVDVQHRHEFVGTTEPAPSDVDHVHAYRTTTSFNAGHRHEIRGVTGPAIPLAEGGHFHYFEGVTSVDGDTPHRHAYKGRTVNGHNV